MDWLEIVAPGANVAVFCLLLVIERRISRIEGAFREHTRGHYHMLPENEVDPG